MARRLLVLSLLLCTAPAFATAPATGETEEAVCPKEQAEREKAATTTPAAPAERPGQSAPVRPRGTSSGRGTPRWHSMLPGMVR